MSSKSYLSLKPKHDDYHYLRKNCDAVEISRLQCVTIFEAGWEGFKALFRGGNDVGDGIKIGDIEYKGSWLLPEHRDLLIDALRGDEAARNALYTPIA